MTGETDPAVAAVVIGRNEGERLVACLTALRQSVDPSMIVYVDSGSTDGSIETANVIGAEVVELDLSRPFTAARARNAGLASLRERDDTPEFVQFLDGDCVLQPDWIDKAVEHMREHDKAAIVCGRRRELRPEVSAYNRLCDREWDTPIGRAKACGGDALMRMTALDEVDGFDPTLIAGEEPELCVRLRQAGWEVWRIDTEMTLHDAAMTRFAQFWKRARRGGHAYAEGAAMHGTAPEYHGVAGTRRAVIWGGALPVLILLAALIFGPLAAFGLVLLYPVQIARLALKDGGTRAAWERAALLTIGKFAEARGVAEYHLNRRLGRRAGLIEYK